MDCLKHNRIKGAKVKSPHALIKCCLYNSNSCSLLDLHVLILTHAQTQISGNLYIFQYTEGHDLQSSLVYRLQVHGFDDVISASLAAAFVMLIVSVRAALEKTCMSIRAALKSW